MGEVLRLHADCVEGVRELRRIGRLFDLLAALRTLFIYSDSERDMGNAANDDEFLEHYVLPAARASPRHQARPADGCPLHRHAAHESRAWRDGALGHAGRHHQKRTRRPAGPTIPASRSGKDPVVEMQRTKAHGLPLQDILQG